MRLIAVVLGSSTGKIRFSTAQEILDHGFANYRKFPVAQEGAVLAERVPVAGGAQDDIVVRLGKELSLLVAKGDESGIELCPVLPEKIQAPVQEGDNVGRMDIVREGAQVGSVPIVAAQSVARRSLADGFGRVLQKWIYR